MDTRKDDLRVKQMASSDLIRMNHLIQTKIDLPEFVKWYETMSDTEQISLLFYLHAFAQQAGYDEQMFQEASRTARLPIDSPLLQELSSFRGGYSRSHGLEDEWLSQRTTTERRLLLPFLVLLFGYADNAIRAKETAETCNHWWHQL